MAKDLALEYRRDGDPLLIHVSSSYTRLCCETTSHTHSFTFAIVAHYSRSFENALLHTLYSCRSCLL